MRTLRFLLIAPAGRVARIAGRNVLRLARDPAIEQLYAGIECARAGLSYLRIGPPLLDDALGESALTSPGSNPSEAYTSADTGG